MSEPSNQATTWRVTSQVPRIKANATNGIEEGYDIAFQTGQGHVGTVFVPNSRYRPDTVRELIGAQAALLDAVGDLSSGS